MTDETSWESEPAGTDTAATAAGQVDTEGQGQAASTDVSTGETTAGQVAVTPGTGEPGAEGGEGAADTDPYAQYKDANGLFLGKFKTPDEVFRAAQEADRLIGQKAYEAEQARREAEQLRSGDRGPQLDPVRDLAPLLRTPPSELLTSEAFVRFGEANGVRWATDDDGCVDPEAPANIANLGYVRDLMREQVTTVQTRAAQAEANAAAAADQFFTAFPHLKGWEADVVAISEELGAAGAFGNDFTANSALLAQRAEARIRQKAASLLGTAGGKAAAETRASVSPVGGTTRSGVGTAPLKDETEW